MTRQENGARPFLRGAWWVGAVASFGLVVLVGAFGKAQGDAGHETAAVATVHAGEPITPVPQPPPSDLRSDLGDALFHDPRLSHGNLRSCAACHDIATSGATGARFDQAPDGHPLHYNTPTVFNAALQFRQDWEGDLRTLEDQADASIQNPDYMASTWAELLGKLRMDRTLTARFQAAYGHDPDRLAVIDALARYERTLVTPDSRFDRWLRGDETALTSDEQDGYRLFKYGGCVTCHQGVAVGANLFQRTDVFQPLFPGRARRMRVASLRNVAVTAPYLDDGSAKTLEDVVDRMAQAQLGSRLSPEQVGKIAAFLRTLTGRYHGNELRPAAADASR